MDPNETQQTALEHAWHWFELHAEQRMTMIRFYLTAAGAIGTGVGYTFMQQAYLLSAILSGMGLVAAFGFWRMDRRVSDLVKVGEKALRVLEAKLAAELDAPAMNICEGADHRNGRLYPYSYRENFQLLFLATGLGFLCILAVSLKTLWCP